MAAKKKNREMLVVASKVKQCVRDAGLMASGDLIEAVNEKVHEILEAAVERTRANKRSTMRPHDL